MTNDTPKSGQLQLLDAVRDVRGVSASERLVLFSLVAHADSHGRSFPSYRRLAEVCSLSRGAVIEAMNTLRDRKVVSVEKRSGDRGNTSNLFTLRHGPLTSLSVVRTDDQVVRTDDHPGPPTEPGESAERTTLVRLPDPEGTHLRNPTKEPNEASRSRVIQPALAEVDADAKPLTSHQRYATSYATGITAATQRAWAFPPGKQPEWDIATAIKTHAPTLRGDALTDWIASSAERFARYVAATGDDPKFWSGLNPKGLLRWLNDGLPDQPIRRDGKIKQPGGSTKGWSVPIGPQPGDSDASTFDPNEFYK